MKFVFLYGQVAAGKLTVARELAAATGYALFHNHLVVDAVAAVFPFGSEPFVRLREQYWLTTIEEAAKAGRSLIFTYAPEASVAADFPERVRALVEGHGGAVVFVALEVSPEVQARRTAEPSREAFGKLRSVELVRQLRGEFDACMAAMPAPALRIDADVTAPDEAARRIAEALGI